MTSKEIKEMTLKELKAIVKQFRSGHVAMGIVDIIYMHSLEDEIDRRQHETRGSKLV